MLFWEIVPLKSSLSTMWKEHWDVGAKDWLTLMEFISITQPFGPHILGDGGVLCVWKCSQLCKLLPITLYFTNLKNKKRIILLSCSLPTVSTILKWIADGMENRLYIIGNDFLKVSCDCFTF